jgi:hypothetical protein
MAYIAIVVHIYNITLNSFLDTFSKGAYKPMHLTLYSDSSTALTPAPARFLALRNVICQQLLTREDIYGSHGKAAKGLY